MNTERRLERTDLSNCDLVPIHIPASIQPHGVLVVLREPDLTITQIIENGGDPASGVLIILLITPNTF
jgi:light-regulated signal transduction histidine kinase (bacteriophytochrome)